MNNKFDLIKYIKIELCAWKPYEIILLCMFLCIIFVNLIVFKDSLFAIISAICGILYTVLAGKGKIYCFIFGLCGTGFYSYLSLINGLYGNLLLYLCYYIPMQIIACFKWKENLKKKSNEIVKTQLSNCQRGVIFFLSFLSSVFVACILAYYNDTQPVKDAITTVFSIVGMYLTVKRCIEQWIIWMIVNGISFFMWLDAVIKGANTYSTVVMWFVYFIVAIYFYLIWKKELRQQKVFII